jgi:hypothetical protein
MRQLVGNAASVGGDVSTWVLGYPVCGGVVEVNARHSSWVKALMKEVT